ncbi:ABC transporter substrate-binding protein [Amycolatopsis sp. NBC_01488]|uniref:ABC transporter substrate-binding protein n=1 Tax=Amycolatopsis sp. NBC_01488 TaxID=2903563 RepID=UPI002E2804E6|nr:ABC transporter substrate-binding protein [Amycolatopsis sp. NBC_01488]
MNHPHTIRARHPRRLRTGFSLRARTLTLTAAVLLIVSACGDTGDPGSSGTQAQTLTLGVASPPPSLDPAKTTGNGQTYLFLAYDPLIYRAPNGTLKPSLATSWNYVGSGNRVFELHLRPNVTFSDGSALTADVVKANFDHLAKVGSGTAANVAKSSTVLVVDPLTVRLTLQQPNPILPTIFTQDTLPGMVSSNALQESTVLATQSAGTGQYVLDPTQSVPNDHYTYHVNPSHWDKAAAHYQTVVVKVIPNPNTALAALKTGQVDVISGNYTTVNSAKSAGLTIAYAPSNFFGLALADRNGTLVPALRDVRVRQALNYAVDRQQITKALFGDYGTATEQIQLPGGDGATTTTTYPYDPGKAKQLLAEAGYPNGLTLPVLTTSQASSNNVVQAMADNLKQVGVQLQMTNDAESSKFQQDVRSKTYPAYGIAFGSLPVHLMAQLLLLPKGFWNPFDSTDAELTSLYQQAASADDVHRAQLDQQIIERVAELGWFVPVTFSPLFYFSRSTVSGVTVTPAEPLANPLEWHPTSS